MTTAAISDRMMTAKPKETRNRSHGSWNTKNPRSRPNCSSLSPNSVRLRHSRKVRHSAAAEPAAKSPSRPEETMTAARLDGSSAMR